MRRDVTWGDFTAMAALRLEVALAAVTDAEGRSTPGRHASRSGALAGTCRLLHQYAGRFGPLAHDPLGIDEDDVARLRGNLDALGRALRDEAAYASPERDPVSRHIADATRFLAFGSDLLASHHGPAGQPRSPYAAYLNSPTVARHVIAETAELASTAGRLAARLGQSSPPSRDASDSRFAARRLAGPAVLIEQAAIGIHRGLNAPRPANPAPGLTHLPVAVTAPPPPVRPGEPRHEALLAVATGADWLAAHTARKTAERPSTIGELPVIADHTAAAHLLSARLLEHTSSLLVPDPGTCDALTSAAHTLRAAAQAWRRAADSWKQAALRSAPQISDPHFVREAEFAGVRLGRTLFSDGWTHRDGTRRTPRAPQDIVATRTDSAALLAAVHAVPAAGQVLAEHTPWIAAAAVEHGVLLSSDLAHNPRGGTPADQFQDRWTRWYPALPQQVVPVTAAYNAARQASGAAQSAVARAAEAAGHPIGRAVLDADRRRTLGFTGDPAHDARRVNAAAARTRSGTARGPWESVRPPGRRAAELAREVGALHPHRGRGR
ncbi:hypothetical protein [Kitasatospora brasiliensis]|uniref:hypothetical protein n=1 Tax=Kitasatospora brasiliensis TaxID=3058040 RepID=UPI00292E59C2|nr:hypothetical protein [Kitasatospora sp. K002]